MRPAFSSRAKHHAEYARQYTGSAGKITNCQIGVFAAYVSHHGHAFIDRALYLPKGWTDDPVRLKATYVPDDVSFSTKPHLRPRCSSARLRLACHSAGLRPIASTGSAISNRTYAKPVKAMYSASIPIIGLHPGKPQRVIGTAEEIAKTQRRSDWRRLSAGAGTKGPRLHDWCYLELADLECEESKGTSINN